MIKKEADMLSLKMYEKTYSKESEHIQNLYSQVRSNRIRVWKKKINAWKNFKWINIDREKYFVGNEKSWMTNEITPLTYIMCITLFQKFYALPFDLPLRISDNEEKYKNEYTWIHKYYDICRRKANILYKIPEAGKDSIVLGYSFLRFGISRDIDDQTKADMENNKEWQEQIKDAMFGASMDICDMTNIVFDKRLGPYTSPYFMYKKQENIHLFMKRRSKFIQIEKNVLEEIESNRVLLDSCDYERYKHIEYELDKYKLIDQFVENTDEHYYSIEQTLKWHAECVEYYTKEHILLMVNSRVIHKMDNYYTIKSNWEIIHPYVQLNSTDTPFNPVPKSVAEELMPLQKMHDVVFNWFWDQIKLSLSSMFKKTWGITIEWFEDGFFEIEPNKIVQIDWSWEFDRIELWRIDPSIFSVNEYIYNFAMMIAKLNRYTMSGSNQPGIERSALAADAQMQITEDGLRPLSAWVSYAMSRGLKIWLLDWLVKIPEDYIFNVWGEIFNVDSRLNYLNFDMKVEIENESINSYNITRYLTQIQNFYNVFREVMMQPDRTWIPAVKFREMIIDALERIGIGKFGIKKEEAEELLSQIQEQQFNNSPQAMIEWTIAMLQQIDDMDNRKRIAEAKVWELLQEWVEFDAEQFLQAVMWWGTSEETPTNFDLGNLVEV